ncbi:MAG: hypothetical protein A2Y34_04010 [Spirochaetes bacterium GWC1_27_15]|nr:MAG: hypothetical protein A2Y34_04010 [Spirochaetes bacterium GWC1_27_15]
MNYINKVIDQIKNAKTDNEIKSAILYIYVDAQFDSSIRKEFDECIRNQIWENQVIANSQ